jgi:hypothetical protein
MRLCLLLPVWKEAAGLISLMAALFCCRCVVSSAAHEPVCFNSIWEFKDFAASKGIHFHSGTANGGIWNDNYYVADHPITLDDVREIPFRRDCGLTPAWRGIVWLAQASHRSGEPVLMPDSIGGKWRIWGHVIVAGDEDLMHRIEELYRTK